MGVNLFDEVCSVLIGFVYSSFDGECFDGVNVRIANDVFEMPLYGVYPTFEIECVFYCFRLIWVVDLLVDVIVLMVVVDCLTEDVVVMIDVLHDCLFYVFIFNVCCSMMYMMMADMYPAMTSIA